jgi:hypothetical protein
MNLLDWQTPISAGLVLLCTGFAAWRLMPNGLRQALALRLGLQPKAGTAAGACGGGCDGCGAGSGRQAAPENAGAQTAAIKFVRPAKPSRDAAPS